MPRVAKKPNGLVQDSATSAQAASAKKPKAPRVKAFNFKARFTSCKKALIGVGKPAWYKLRYEIGGGWYMDLVEEDITLAIKEIQEACTGLTATGDVKIQGIETLLDIASLLAKTNGLEFDADLDQKELQQFLMSKAYAAVKEIWASMVTGANDPFASERFPPLQSKLERHRPLSALWATSRIAAARPGIAA